MMTSNGIRTSQRDRVTRVRAEIRMRFEVGEHRRDVCGAGEPGRKNFARDLLEQELVALSIQGGDDLVEAQEIADQRQVLPWADAHTLHNLGMAVTPVRDGSGRVGLPCRRP